MSEPVLTPADQRRFWLLIGTLFVAYACVAMPLATVSVFVATRLGLGSGWAGLAVGVAFLSTILTRGPAGVLADSRGSKIALMRGLGFYAAGALASLIPALLIASPWAAYATLIIGRLLIGLGESLVGVGVISWGVSILGPQRAGRVMAMTGAAIYGALAIGGPLGLVLFNLFGFEVAMAASAVLPLAALVVVAPLTGPRPHPAGQRPSLSAVLGKIWLPGSIVGLQGIGFAAIGAFFVLHFLQQGWSYSGLGLAAFGGGFVLMRFTCGHLPDRIGGLPVATGSLAVEVVGQLTIWLAHDPVTALVGAFLTGLGCSMIFPAMGREVVHLVEPRLRGTALGGFSAFQDLAYGVTGPVAGLIAARAGYGSVFAFGAAAAAAGLAVALWLRARARA